MFQSPILAEKYEVTATKILTKIYCYYYS